VAALIIAGRRGIRIPRLCGGKFLLDIFDKTGDPAFGLAIERFSEEPTRLGQASVKFLLVALFDAHATPPLALISDEESDDLFD
jgi:hypothetical protein